MSQLLHWIPVSDNMMSVHMIEAKILLLEVSTTTLSPSIWHMKSVHITEGKFLLLEVTTTTLSPSFWHHDVSTHDWGKVTTARGQYYYIESKFLTPWCQYTWLRPSSSCEWFVLLHWVPVSDTWSKYTSLRPSFYCYRSVLLHWVLVSDTWNQYTSLRPSFFS